MPRAPQSLEIRPESQVALFASAKIARWCHHGEAQVTRIACPDFGSPGRGVKQHQLMYRGFTFKDQGRFAPTLAWLLEKGSNPSFGLSGFRQEVERVGHASYLERGVPLAPSAYVACWAAPGRVPPLDKI